MAYRSQSQPRTLPAATASSNATVLSIDKIALVFFVFHQVSAEYSWMTKDDITKLLVRRYQELPKHKRFKYERKERELKAIHEIVN